MVPVERIWARRMAASENDLGGDLPKVDTQSCVYRVQPRAPSPTAIFELNGGVIRSSTVTDSRLFHVELAGACEDLAFGEVSVPNDLPIPRVIPKRSMLRDEYLDFLLERRGQHLLCSLEDEFIENTSGFRCAPASCYIVLHRGVSFLPTGGDFGLGNRKDTPP